MGYRAIVHPRLFAMVHGCRLLLNVAQRGISIPDREEGKDLESLAHLGRQGACLRNELVRTWSPWLELSTANDLRLDRVFVAVHY